MEMNSTATSSDIGFLQRLNNDVFLQIMEELRPGGNLHGLSATCRAIRELCKPVLFQRCELFSYVEFKHKFLPEEIWPFISSLTLRDHCPDLTAGRPANYYRMKLLYAAHPLLCGIYDPSLLDHALRNMPRLRTVKIVQIFPTEHHGLPWSTVQTILSIPHLQRFIFGFHQLVPTLLADEVLRLDSPAPLKVFRYMLPDTHKYPRKHDSEVAALAVIFEGLHFTLEELDLPVDPVPLSVLSSLQWPVLHTLKLRGQRPADPHDITLFAGMPGLRTLELRFAMPPKSSPAPWWPDGLETHFPCSVLQSLLITFPCADDRLYSHLPYTLRSLSLASFPHASYTDRRWAKTWRAHLLDSSQVLEILQRCTLPNLGYLELEYIEDDREHELFSHIGAAFPELATLKVRRYRAIEAEDISTVCDALHKRVLKAVLTGCIAQTAFAQMLLSVPRLRDLWLHLDFPDNPPPQLLQYGPGYAEIDLAAFTRNRLDPTADAFALTLPSPLTDLHLLIARCDRSHWVDYRIRLYAHAETSAGATRIGSSVRMPYPTP
ncbi:hypothetical protein GY45DRAFT_1324234 [Cubamyces sp. BRFM 1775]|nr:hypothetical protein GY45DRAFT_1324234 [Cubamyces sp. BRFM 1775]